MTKYYPTLLRCYARPEGDHYIGQCLELDLAVQADSIHEIRQKMDECLKSYFDSLDSQNVQDLFPRPAPFPVWLDYYRVCLLLALHQILQNLGKNVQVFQEQVVPQHFAIHPIG